MFAQISDYRFLAAQFVGLFHPGSQDRVSFRRIAADDQDEAGVLDVSNRSGVTSVTNRAKQAGGGGGLAIARAIIHVVCADDSARQFLHEVALLIGALRRGDKCERVRPVFGLDLGKAPRHQTEGFLPSRLPKLVAFTNQRLGQPVGTINKTPPELYLYT